MSVFVKRFQPELYEKWLDGTDIAPHPEDPEDVARDIREHPEAYMMSMKNNIAGREEDIYIYQTPDGRSLR